MIRVLIADDDKLARMGLISLIPWEKCGMTVVGEVSNGERALAFLENHQVDLCVVDLAMPVMTGLEFIQQARIKYPRLQYVVLSFHEDFENVQAALRLGTLDYISKMRLDQKDCEEVFLRVGKMISQLERESFVESDSLPLKSDLQEEWLQFYWLYSSQTMDNILQRTAANAPSCRQLEHILIRLFDKAKELFPFALLPSVPSVHQPDIAIEWLKQFKKTLAQALPNVHSSQHEVCVFHAVSYIRQHLSESLSIHQVAAQVGISRSYFAATFKKITGLTFNNFIRQERIAKAKQLLQSHQATPSSVSHLVGYEDESYFCRIFTEQTGSSISTFYRKFC